MFWNGITTVLTRSQNQETDNRHLWWNFSLDHVGLQHAKREVCCLRRLLYKSDREACCILQLSKINTFVDFAARVLHLKTSYCGTFEGNKPMYYQCQLICYFRILAPPRVENELNTPPQKEILVSTRDSYQTILWNHPLLGIENGLRPRQRESWCLLGNLSKLTMEPVPLSCS